MSGFKLVGRWEIGGGWRAGDRARARGAGGPRAGRTPTPNLNSSSDAKGAEKKKWGKTPQPKEMRRDANATGLMVRPHDL